MDRNTIPDNFTMGLALFDSLPVIFFGLSAVLLGMALKSPMFVIGAVLCFAAGAAKVLWKIIVVLKKKNIWQLFIQMRIMMPIGFILMAAAFLIGRGQKQTEYILQAGSEMPVAGFLLAGLAGMILMGIFGFTLNSADKKSNWIEQITNCIAQLVILAGVILLVYGADYYAAEEAALAALADTETVQVVTTKDEVIFLPENSADAKTGFIFYPGAKVEFTAYAPLMKEVAEGGITCVIERMPLNLAFFGINKAQKVMDEHPQIGKWYIGGHSLGGVAASVFTKENKEALSGLILLASYSTKDLGEFPVLAVYGSRDGVLSMEAYLENRINIETMLTEKIIEGGNHAGFGYYGVQNGDGIATITAKEQIRLTEESITAFISER